MVDTGIAPKSPPKTRKVFVVVPQTGSNDAKRLIEIDALETAWQTYVGRGTTPSEFLMYAREETVQDAVDAYVAELPAAMGYEYTDEELADIRTMLIEYIREMGPAGPLRV